MDSKKGALEKSLAKKHQYISGIDEVGRGCIAGPVYAAAAILDYEKLFDLSEKDLGKIRDSKTLSAKQRAQISPLIKEVSKAYAIKKAQVHEIEDLGIVPATFLAMKRALKAISTPIDYLLIDGKYPLEGYKGQQQAVIKGDHLCFSIAAASILAKQARDEEMIAAAQEYPAYGFETHVGYGTQKHRDAMTKFGPCPLHRRNFAPVRALL